MKSAARILSVLILAGLSLFYISCDKGGGGTENVIDQQIEKLNGSWDATTVTLDGLAPPISQAEFVIEINGVAGNSTINFETTRPTGSSPWPPSGTFQFDSNNPTGVLIRNDGGGETVVVEYTVSGNTLVMDFQFDGNPFPAGRAENVNGEWHYEFTRM